MVCCYITLQLWLCVLFDCIVKDVANLRFLSTFANVLVDVLVK